VTVFDILKEVSIKNETLADGGRQLAYLLNI
jgi:hypothetical protein